MAFKASQGRKGILRQPIADLLIFARSRYILKNLRIQATSGETT